MSPVLFRRGGWPKASDVCLLQPPPAFKIVASNWIGLWLCHRPLLRPYVPQQPLLLLKRVAPWPQNMNFKPRPGSCWTSLLGHSTLKKRSSFASWYVTSSTIHVFLRNQLYLGRTDVTSFCMHFEKIGHGLLREGKRSEGEWAVLAKSGGMNRKYRSCKIKVKEIA